MEVGAGAGTTKARLDARGSGGGWMRDREASWSIRPSTEASLHGWNAPRGTHLIDLSIFAFADFACGALFPLKFGRSGLMAVVRAGAAVSEQALWRTGRCATQRALH